MLAEYKESLNPCFTGIYSLSNAEINNKDIYEVS